MSPIVINTLGADDVDVTERGMDGLKFADVLPVCSMRCQLTIIARPTPMTAMITNAAQPTMPIM
jgi:hypothetical protein